MDGITAMRYTGGKNTFPQLVLVLIISANAGVGNGKRREVLYFARSTRAIQPTLRISVLGIAHVDCAPTFCARNLRLK